MIVRMVNTLQIVLSPNSLTWPQHVHVHFGGLMVMGPCTIILERVSFCCISGFNYLFIFFSPSVTHLHMIKPFFFGNFELFLPQWCKSWNESKSWAQWNPNFTLNLCHSFLWTSFLWTLFPYFWDLCSQAAIWENWLNLRNLLGGGG
jgi:hypothetical protein